MSHLIHLDIYLVLEVLCIKEGSASTPIEMRLFDEFRH